MVFQELDKWMLNIEDKRNPSAKERRLHLKLNRVRDETHARYLKVFNANAYSNQHHAPIHCRERAMSPYARAFKNVTEVFTKAFGGDI